MRSTLALITAVTLILGSLGAPFAAPAVAAYGDNEPNDQLYHAAYIDPGLFGAIAGDIHSYSDIDYFSFRAEEGETFVFEAYNVEPGADPTKGLRMAVYDEGGNVHSLADTGAGEVAQTLVFQAPYENDFFVGVRGYYWYGRYSLRGLHSYDHPRAEWDSANDMEPNNLCAIAAPIDVGPLGAQTHALAPTLSDVVSYGPDIDAYSFAVEPQQRYVVELSGPQPLPQPGALGIQLIVDGETGAVALWDGEGAKVSYSARSSKDVCVRVWSRPEWSGVYSLRVCHGACNQALDPRILAQALPLSLGPAAAQGTLGQQGDTQLFRLDAAPGRTYIVETFDAQRGAGGSTAITVYDAGGRYLRSGMTGYGNVDQTLVVTTLADAPLYVRVAGREGWAGSFRLRVLARFDQPGAAWGEDLEPNDWCELATPLLVGAGPETHSLAQGNPAFVTHYPDGDSYRLKIEAGQRYEVLADGLPVDSPQGAVTIYVHEMATGEFLGWGAPSGAGGRPASLGYHATQSGELCVRVTAAIWPAHWSGPYTIRVCEALCLREVFLPALHG